ncbi:retrovirus-related pol polyprotein from transposon TNT 1-94, partial [Tanacetum coccineum]
KKEEAEKLAATKKKQAEKLAATKKKDKAKKKATAEKEKSEKEAASKKKEATEKKAVNEKEKAEKEAATKKEKAEKKAATKKEKAEKKVGAEENEETKKSENTAVRDFKKFFRRRGKFVRQPYDDKKNFRKAKEDKKEDRKCFKCGDPNHFISDCPKNSFNDKKAFVVGCWSDSGDDKEEICLMAHENEVRQKVKLEPDEWIKDNGCSRHMTGNKKLFSTYKEIDGAFDHFEILSKKIQIQKGCPIISIRTDHGREFDNEVQFGAFCDANGITHNFSAPRTPQSNGVVERKNRTLQEMSRTMLNEQSIPQKFWCNAVDTSTYILNRILIRPFLGKTPYELFKGKKPSLEYFKVFGSKCFILNTKDYLTKFDPKSTEGVFLGYSPNSKAYIVLNKETMKVEESLNVKFDESPPPKSSPLVDDDILENDIIENQDKDLEIKENEPLNKEISNTKNSKDHPLGTVIGNLNERTLRSHVQNQSNFFCFVSSVEPKNVKEAIQDESWTMAMQEELNQFKTNDVWSLVPPPENQTIIAQGYNQQEGIDFDETYAPVARLESIRILLAYACAHDFKLFQMDVKSAFLNGFINEEVYVAQPPGFVDFEKPNHVFKLKKALYGLKQAPKAWYDRLKAFLLDHLYTMGLVDNTLFTKKRNSHIIIVQIYVDDIIFGSTCQELCDDFSKIMHDEFEMSMMGELNFFLGLQIKQLEDGIFFNQSKYVKEMLKKFGLEDSKPIKTPMSSETKLTRDEDGEPIDDTKYRGMIGSLLYLTASRPDIMFSVCLCARFQEAPKTSHLEAVKRIFRYIKKQTALAISTTEAEYVSAKKACQQALWMKQALVDYDIKLDDIPVLCDNKGAIDLTINLDPIELLFSTPHTSPQAFLNSLEDLPPVTTNPPPPRPSFDPIERLANEPPPIPPIDSSIHSPTSDMEPPIPSFPPQC